MQSKIFLTIFFVLVVVIGCSEKSQISTTKINEPEFPNDSVDPTPTSELLPRFPITNREGNEECLAQGGRWDILGLKGEGCNYPTTDFGQTCKDSVECEGSCFAYLDGIMKENVAGFLFPDLDAIEERNANEEEILGYCSEWQFNTSLLILIEDGKIKTIIAD